MDALMDKLEELGVQCVDDLSLVAASDIVGTLPLIQCRRLVKAFEADSQAATPFTSPVRGPTTSPLPQRDLPPTPPADSPSCEIYSVPWHKMPAGIMNSIAENKRIPPNKRGDMIRLIIDDYISKQKQRPSRSQLREIAQKIVDEYPLSFKETEPFGNQPFAKDGAGVLFAQLENRVENVRRQPTSGKKPAGGEDSRQKRSRNSDRYGCVEWQPAVEGTTSRAELQSKREELKSAFKTKDPLVSSVQKLMSETYAIQREAINDGTCVKLIMEEWPFLFEAAHLFDHASKLLGFPVQDKLAQELSRKETGINNFLDSKGMKIGEGPIQLIYGIARYFKENPDHLFYQNEDSANVELCNLPCTPCILIRGDQQFKIAVDQVIVNDHITSPIVALAYAFALFYVCNVEYPKEMALTLEFMQRVFCGINPDRGSKAEQKGKRHHIPPRLFKLVTQLKDFEWGI